MKTINVQYKNHALPALPEKRNITPEDWNHTGNVDFIDVEFTDVTEKTKNDVHSENHEENTHDVNAPITVDDWRKAAAGLDLRGVFRDLRNFRDRIRYNKKFNRKRLYNPPLRKSELLAAWTDYNFIHKIM